MRIKFPRSGTHNLSIRDESGRKVLNRTNFVYAAYIDVPESWMPFIDKGYFLFVSERKHGEFKSE